MQETCKILAAVASKYSLVFPAIYSSLIIVKWLYNMHFSEGSLNYFYLHFMIVVGPPILCLLVVRLSERLTVGDETERKP
jgi:hypothetical protein